MMIIFWPQGKLEGATKQAHLSLKRNFSCRSSCMSSTHCMTRARSMSVALATTS